MGRGPEGRGQREGSWAERGELEKVGIVQGGGRTKREATREATPKEREAVLGEKNRERSRTCADRQTQGPSGRQSWRRRGGKVSYVRIWDWN